MEKKSERMAKVSACQSHYREDSYSSDEWFSCATEYICRLKIFKILCKICETQTKALLDLNRRPGGSGSGGDSEPPGEELHHAAAEKRVPVCCKLL